MAWENEFRRRIENFHSSKVNKGDGIPISIKIKPSGGCFHREHSPLAYKIIDEYLLSHISSDFEFEEHESGPEILVYLAFATASISFSASIINLISNIIKARTQGVKRGDNRDSALELIVRGFDEDGILCEEKVLTIQTDENVSEELIERALLTTTTKMFPPKVGKKKGEIQK